MAKYIYKPSGLVVEAGEGATLPRHLYEPLEEAKAEQPKPKTRRAKKAPAKE